jgi:hypothetical protein
LQNIVIRTEDGTRIRDAFLRREAMTYDTHLDVPPVRPEPEPPIKTTCIGGPWHGATITHDKQDTTPRHTHGGVYKYGQFGLVKAWVWDANGL